MNKENLKSQDNLMFEQAEFGARIFEKQRQNWVSKNQQKKPLPVNYAR